MGNNICSDAQLSSIADLARFKHQFSLHKSSFTDLVRAKERECVRKPSSSESSPELHQKSPGSFYGIANSIRVFETAPSRVSCSLSGRTRKETAEFTRCLPLSISTDTIPVDNEGSKISGSAPPTHHGQERDPLYDAVDENCSDKAHSQDCSTDVKRRELVSSHASYVVLHLQRTPRSRFRPSQRRPPRLTNPSTEMSELLDSCERMLTPRGLSSVFGFNNTNLAAMASEGGADGIFSSERIKGGGQNNSNSKRRFSEGDADMDKSSIGRIKSHLSSHSKAYVYTYNIFVFNGKNSSPFVSAINISAAYDLEKLLRGQDSFLACLFYNLFTSGTPIALDPRMKLTQYDTTPQSSGLIDVVPRKSMNKDSNLNSSNHCNILATAVRHTARDSVAKTEGEVRGNVNKTQKLKLNTFNTYKKHALFAAINKVLLSPRRSNKKQREGALRDAISARRDSSEKRVSVTCDDYLGSSRSNLPYATPRGMPRVSIPPIDRTASSSFSCADSVGDAGLLDEERPPPIHRFITTPGEAVPAREAPSPPVADDSAYRESVLTADSQSPHRGLGLTRLSLEGMQERRARFQDASDERGSRLKELFPVASEILPYLFVGGEGASQDRAQLLKLGVTVVINTGAVAVQNYFPEDFEYVTLYLCDAPDERIENIFPIVNSTIERARQQNGVVFVHCHQGVSRSATVVIAYLMWYNGWTYEEALKFAKAKRSILSPNGGFVVKLMLYERLLTKPPLRCVLAYMPYSSKYPLPFVYRTVLPVTKNASGKTAEAQFILDARTCYAILDRRPPSFSEPEAPEAVGRGAGAETERRRTLVDILSGYDGPEGSGFTPAYLTYFPSYCVIPGENDVYRVWFLCGSQTDPHVAEDAFKSLQIMVRHYFYVGKAHIAASQEENGWCDKMKFEPVSFEISLPIKEAESPVEASEATTDLSSSRAQRSLLPSAREVSFTLRGESLKPRLWPASAITRLVADVIDPTHGQATLTGETLNLSVVIGRDGRNDAALASDVSALYQEMLCSSNMSEWGHDRRKRQRKEVLKGDSASEQGTTDGVSKTRRDSEDAAATQSDSAPCDASSAEIIGRLPQTLPTAYEFPFDPVKNSLTDFIDLDDLINDSCYALFLTGKSSPRVKEDNGTDSAAQRSDEVTCKFYLWRGGECNETWDAIHKALDESPLLSYTVVGRTLVRDLQIIQVEEGDEPQDLTLL